MTGLSHTTQYNYIYGMYGTKYWAKPPDRHRAFRLRKDYPKSYLIL